ncbi:MAG: hypothetical protein ACTSPS_11495 [Promethearchaeota archaeon]
MILSEIIATNASEVGQSWFDFFSIGHICFGIGVFLFFSLGYSIPKSRGDTPILSLLAVFILTFIILIAWEVVENTLFIDIGWKFGDRDSPRNILTDIVLGTIGALGMLLWAYEAFEKGKKHWPYYVFGLIMFFIWLSVFGIFGLLTLS